MKQIDVSEYLERGWTFGRIFDEVPASELLTEPQAMEWPAAFVVHHMADAQLHFATRYLHILTEESPTLTPFDEDKYPSRLHYNLRSPLVSLDTFLATRSLLANLLTNAEGEDLDRMGIHVERGEMSLWEVHTLAEGHLDAHIQQLLDIKQKIVGKGGVS